MIFTRNDVFVIENFLMNQHIIREIKYRDIDRTLAARFGIELDKYAFERAGYDKTLPDIAVDICISDQSLLEVIERLIPNAV